MSLTSLFCFSKYLHLDNNMPAHVTLFVQDYYCRQRQVVKYLLCSMISKAILKDSIRHLILQQVVFKTHSEGKSYEHFFPAALYQLYSYSMKGTEQGSAEWSCETDETQQSGKEVQE